MLPPCSMKISSQKGAIRMLLGIGNGTGINALKGDLNDNTPFALTYRQNLSLFTNHVAMQLKTCVRLTKRVSSGCP